jgi:hypothetical protein
VTFIGSLFTTQISDLHHEICVLTTQKLAGNTGDLLLETIFFYDASLPHQFAAESLFVKQLTDSRTPLRARKGRRTVLVKQFRILSECYTLHPTPYTLQPTPRTPYPQPHTLHPATCTLQPTLCTPHPTPSTLHPTPRNLYPTPHTLHPAPYTLQSAPCTIHPLNPELRTLHPEP